MLKRELRLPRLALRGEYMPPEKSCGHAALARYVSDHEYQQALAAAREMGLELVD